MYFEYSWEAAEDFRTQLESALKCVLQNVQLILPSAVYAATDGDVFTLALNDASPSKLDVQYNEKRGPKFDNNVEPPLFLVFSMTFRIQEHDDDGFRVSIVEYVFSLRTKSNDGTFPALLDWHWHPESSQPGTRTYPHLHIRNRLGDLIQNFNKRHIATSRMTIEDVVEFLIRDCHVEPLRDDWEELLDENRAIYRERRQRY